MAVTVKTDVVDDQDILSNERVVDMDDELKILEPEYTQFYTILQKLSSKPANSSKVEWLEDQLFPRLSSLSASITSGAGTMVVASGEGPYFRFGDIVRIPSTGEAVAVSAAPSTDTVGIIRSVGAVAAASAATSGKLVIIGNASAQGASLGKRAVTQRVAQYNYTQIFRHPYGFTETLAASKLYTGSEPAKERKKKGVEHKRALEMSLFFGGRDFYSAGIPTGGTEPTTTMGGLYEYISTLVKDPSGTMDKAEFETFMTAFLHRARNPVLFVAPLVASVISGFARDNWVQAAPGEFGGQSTADWGIRVDGFVSGAFGFKVPVIVKREWNDFPSTPSGEYGGIAFGVDLDYCVLRPLRSTRLLLNRQGPSDDQQVEEYLSEISVEIAQEAHHMFVKNVTG